MFDAHLKIQYIPVKRSHIEEYKSYIPVTHRLAVQATPKFKLFMFIT